MDKLTSQLEQQMNIQRKEDRPDCYRVECGQEWLIGHSIHGGYLAAVFNCVMRTHLCTILSPLGQPDILSLHISYLNVAKPKERYKISIKNLRVGRHSSVFEVQIWQKNTLIALALITSTSLATALGPSIETRWRLLPAPTRRPNFHDLKHGDKDPNWAPFRFIKSFPSFGERLEFLLPRSAFPADNVFEWWVRFPGEFLDETNVTACTDLIPSMHDLLLKNDMPYDGETWRRWANLHDDTGERQGFAQDTKKLRDVRVVGKTASLNIEYKRAIDKHGGEKEWIFVRCETKSIINGRLDIDVTICDEDMELVLLARQILLLISVDIPMREAKRDTKL